MRRNPLLAAFVMATELEIKRRLKEAINEILDSQDQVIKDEDTPYDLNLDSMDVVEMLIDIEDEFDITLKDDNQVRFTPIAELAKRIARQIA